LLSLLAEIKKNQDKIKKAEEEKKKAVDTSVGKKI
jgi:hypothetical protein